MELHETESNIAARLFLNELSDNVNNSTYLVSDIIIHDTSVSATLLIKGCEHESTLDFNCHGFRDIDEELIIARRKLSKFKIFINTFISHTEEQFDNLEARQTT